MRRTIRLPPLKTAPDRVNNNFDWPRKSPILLQVSSNDHHTGTLPAIEENEDYGIDCVLIYTDELDINTDEPIRENSSSGSLSFESKQMIRNQFEEHLIDERHLNLSYEKIEKIIEKYPCFKQCCSKLIRKTTYCVAIRTPFQVLLSTAENIRMKLPVEKVKGRAKTVATQTTTRVFTWERFKRWFNRLFDDQLSSKVYRPFYRTEVYSFAKIDRFLPLFTERNRSRNDIMNFPVNKDNFWSIAKKNYFTSTERYWLTCELLSRVRGKIRLRDNVEYKYFGIRQLISDGVYQSCYPLHESLTEKDTIVHESTDRDKLRQCWVPLHRCLKFQPLDMVRAYMGEKVAFYFAAMGYYTMALILPAIFGLIVFLYGIGSLHSDTPTSDICGKFGQTTNMCPLCDKTCPFWKLSESCLYAQISYVFDNVGTFVFAILMSFWARGYVEFWKRHQAKLQYKWDSVDFDNFNEPMRPEFESKRLPKRENPRTGRPEPFISQKMKIERYLVSIIVVVIMIIIVCLTIFATIIYRIQMSYVLEKSFDSSSSSVIITITTALMNLICSLLLSYVYYTIAQKLTNWELHKHQSDHEAAFSIKIYIFEFVNFYSSLFYVAFFKGRTSGYPSTYGIQRTNDFNEQCDPAGCMVELSIQLIIIMIGKQLINGFIEYGIPYISSRKCCRKKQNQIIKQWKIDKQLNEFDWQMLVPEYLEMTIQFGFVTLFVAAFPLAPLFAFINNLFELRFDAWKFLTQYRRPVFYKAADIGIWTNILSVISYLAVLTNGAVIAWTSEFIPKLVYQIGENSHSDLNGFVNWTLSAFPISDYNRTGTLNLNVPTNLAYCRYRDFRESTGPDYEHTNLYWHTIAARLAFMIIFENVIYFVVYLIQLIVPDVDSGIQDAIDRHRYGEQQRRASSTLESDDVEQIKQESKQFLKTDINNTVQKKFRDQETNTHIAR